MNLEHFKRFFNKWELRGSILFSLLLQIVLISSGNRRKRSSSKIVVLVLWLAYLSADWVATFSLGLISNTLGNSDSNYNRDMLAFWTPFLLLHLGGPDTITAFSVEDSQLWLRHCLSLVLQFGAVGYIFSRSMGGSKFLFPTICVLVAGVLKYGERTWALKKSSMDGLRGSLIKERTPGPDYVNVMDVLSSNLFAGKPGMLHVKKEFEESKVVQSSTSETRKPNAEQFRPSPLLPQAYFFFQIFKKLFVDLALSFHDQQVSRSIFGKIKTSEAYRLIETELNFIYDILFTKASVVHTFHGRVLRVFSFTSTLAAFILFYFIEKNEFQKIDIILTYVLIWGALFLEIVSLCLFVFSDWTIIIILRSPVYNLTWLAYIIFKILSVFRSPTKPRWSHSIGQCSFLKFCASDKPTFFRKILDILGMKDIWDEFWFIEHTTDLKVLQTVIYEDLLKKSQDLDPKLNNCRGEQALGQEEEGYHGLKWSVEAEFDESLLLWHIATEICFNRDMKTNENPYREASRVLSQYMLYLIMARPLTLSSTAGLGIIRYQDTLEEARRYFNEDGLVSDASEACKMLMNVNTYVQAREVKGDRSKSVLWDAVQLAKEMKELDEERMWKVACHVWIEMLCFAARHCRGYYHAQLLCVGGELLSIVWLLEIHLGMGIHYQIKSGHFMTRYEQDV